MPKVNEAQKVRFDQGYAKGVEARQRLIAWFKRLFRRG